MKPITAFLAAALLGLLLSAGPVSAEGRPSPAQLDLMLSGEVSRSVQSDGGGLALYTTDAGIACATVATGGVYELHCSVAAHVCPWGDGGCSITAASPNYGRPVGPSSAATPAPYVVTMTQGAQDATKLLCAIPSASATMTCAVFRLR